AGCAPAGHEGPRTSALARGNLLQGAAGRHGSGLILEQTAVAAPRELVAVFDEEPARLPAGARVAQPHQHPAAAQPLTRQSQLQLPRRERLPGAASALRLPVAPIPDFDGPAAILSLRDRALEVTVIQRMILDL